MSRHQTRRFRAITVVPGRRDQLRASWVGACQWWSCQRSVRPGCPPAVERRGRRLGPLRCLWGGHGGSVTVLTQFILCWSFTVHLSGEGVILLRPSGPGFKKEPKAILSVVKNFLPPLRSFTQGAGWWQSSPTEGASRGRLCPELAV